MSNRMSELRYRDSGLIWVATIVSLIELPVQAQIYTLPPATAPLPAPPPPLPSTPAATSSTPGAPPSPCPVALGVAPVEAPRPGRRLASLGYGNVLLVAGVELRDGQLPDKCMLLAVGRNSSITGGEQDAKLVLASFQRALGSVVEGGKWPNPRLHLNWADGSILGNWQKESHPSVG